MFDLLIYLPNSIRQYIENRPNLKKAITNTGWLTLERGFRMGLGVLVSVLVARHLGPEQFGILSYALSIVSFLGTFVYLGLSGLVVRDVVRAPYDKDLLLGTTFVMKMTGSMVTFCCIIGVAFFAHGSSDKEFWVLCIIGLSLFGRPFETIDFWFQSQVQSKYSVIAKTSAYLSTSILKILLVLLGASVVAIAVASSLEIIVASFCLILIYRYKGHSIFQWKARMAKAKALFSESWIIILSGFLGMVNLKIDQIMLRWISGKSEVGIYSVAVSFSEIWYFIPSFLVMSVYPRLIELQKTDREVYEKRLQQAFDVLFLLSFSVACTMTFIAGPLIPLIYGDAYAGSSTILVIHVWAGIFMFMRALFSKWVFIEDTLFFSLVSHGSGAAVNVLLNLILIPKFGGRGAATATLFSYAASSYLFLFFCPKTQSLARKMSKSFLLPIRIVLYRGKMWV